MKYALFLPLAMICFAFSNGALTDDRPDLKSPESMPDYQITSRKKVATLPPGSTFVMFTFMGSGPMGNDTIRMSCNGKEEKIVPDKNGQFAFQTTAGKCKFQFYLNEDYYELVTDSIYLEEQYRTDITFWFSSAKFPVIAEKPVIYVYPDKTMDVNIQLNVNGKLGFTYPQYNSGWNFTADPDGTIHMNDKSYDYLFWDGQCNAGMTNADQQSGFIVETDSLISFFEEKLTAMGLNAREQEDFITYWCPRMQSYTKCFIHFMFTEEYDEVAAMKITPKPDHIFRVFMMWSDGSQHDEKKVTAQKIESFKREGFSVVEWGGGEYFVPTLHDEPSDLSIDEPGIH